MFLFISAICFILHFYLYISHNILVFFVGYKRECRTKYYTECSTDMVYHNMVEDYPVCGVSKHKKCTESGDCMMVPVMKCKIEKRTIRLVYFKYQSFNTIYLVLCQPNKLKYNCLYIYPPIIQQARSFLFTFIMNIVFLDLNIWKNTVQCSAILKEHGRESLQLTDIKG